MLGAQIGAGLCAAGVLCALGAAWWALGQRPRTEARIARALLLPFGLALTMLAAPCGARLGQRGSWQCELCGRGEFRERFAGVVVRREPWRTAEERQVLDSYSAWIEPLVFVEYLKAKSDALTILSPHVGANFWVQKHTFNVKADLGYKSTKRPAVAPATGSVTQKDLLATVQAQVFF